MRNILFASVLLVSINIQQASSQSFSLLGSGCNNIVYSIAGDASSNIYAAGTFDHAGGNTANRVAKWNGTAWSDMDNGMDNSVRTLAMFNNELYAGGNFIYAGSAPTVVWMVTKWNGSAWTALNNGVRGVGVYSLAVYNSELYAGGFFDTVFNAGKAIVKWNGGSWVAVGAGQNNGVFGTPGYKVKAMISHGGSLYVGGTFTTAGGIPANNIAKWNGTSWSAIGTGMNGDVNAFAVHNGDLFVGGDFTTADGVTVNHVAKLTGNTFVAINGGTNGTVNALASYQNNLFATGNFSTSGGLGTQNISRWDGPSWHYLSPTGVNGIDGTGNTLLTHNGNLYIGGLFAVAGPLIQANSIVKWNMPTRIDGVNPNTASVAVYPNPSPGKFQLELTGRISQKFDLYITDVSGRTIYYRHVDSYNKDMRFDIASFKSGIYFLKLADEANVYSTKLIVE